MARIIPLTSEEQRLFDELQESRRHDSKTFKKPAYIGIWKSIVDKYPESAHFIYELLQNADDAKATEVSMIIGDNYLIFKHNGTEGFTITREPEDEEEIVDYGHINSITAVGASTKANDNGTNKIGKFGVGFKSVFHITDRPEIYDDKFRFAIEDYIVPTPLDHDHKERRDGETLFYFPFKEGINQRDVILSKLRALNNNNPLLFLRYLCTIKWKESSDDHYSVCSKKVLEHVSVGDIRCDLLSLTNGDSSKKMYQFKHEIQIGDSNHDISVGFYITDDGKDIDTSNQAQKVYCFFPTSETFNVCFVSHAPFLLTDSRQQLKCDGGSDEQHNRQLISALADLAANALPILRDRSISKGVHYLNDNILSIIPIDYTYEESGESDICANKVFYDAFVAICGEEPLLLSRGGHYLMPERSRLISNKKLKDILSEKQLNALFVDADEDEEPIDIISDSISSNKPVEWDFLTDILDVEELTPEDVVKSITAAFMESQTINWVKQFYSFLRNEAPNLWKLQEQTKNKSLPVWYAPIIKTTDGLWVAPYTNGGYHNVFLNNGIPIEGYNVVSSELDGKFTHLFLEELGIREPDKDDYINNIVFGFFNKCDSVDLDGGDPYFTYFRDLVSYRKTVGDDKKDAFLEKARSVVRLLARLPKDVESVYYAEPNKVYDDTELIKQYFNSFASDDVYIFDYSLYEDCIKEFGKDYVRKFILELGINEDPVTCRQYKYYWNLPYRFQYRFMQWTSDSYKRNCDVRLTDYDIIGIKHAVRKNLTPELSLAIWNWMSENTVKAVCKFTYRNCLYTEDANSTAIDHLREFSWLYDSEGNQVKAADVTQEELLSAGYSNRPYLFDALNIQKEEVIEPEPEEEVEERSEEEIKQDIIKDNTPEEVKAMKELWEKTQADLKRQEEEKQQKRERKMHNPASEDKSVPKNGLQDDDFKDDGGQIQPKPKKQKEASPKSIDTVLQDFDEKIRIEKEELEYVDALREQVVNAKQYSYSWFKSLMELECRANGTANDENSTKRSIYILFNRIEFDSQSPNIVILKDSSRYIPMSLEDIENIPVTFYLRSGSTIKIEFEAASVKDGILRLKVRKRDTELLLKLKENVDYVGRCELNMDKPIDLLTKWHNLLESLNYSAEYSFKDEIRPDIDFIYGPPGTGKTTHLAKMITSLIEENPKCKILVLTPTNKACDVLTRKLLDMNKENDSWIWRFVATMDESLEKEEVVYGRECDLDGQDQACVISTIARYAFDGFQYAHLNDYPWDHVIIDEASMIPLYQIIMPLALSSEDTHITIAGDPFQIEPIVKIDDWKEENIYKMVNLNDFANVKTEPHKFNVAKLMTQYRSVPSIGEVYSQFAYGGLLQHHREESSQRLLSLGLPAKTHTIISFPVNNESLYETKKLGTSNIHLYSVLLAVELLKYITANIARDATDVVRIGVISPYSAEYQAIDKLASQVLESNDKIMITYGTTHGFQGDECDIVICVFNPPASGMVRASDKVFINKINILNVAISRAKDYSIVLIPDKEYKYFDEMFRIKRLGKLIMATKNCQTFSAGNIENLIFGESAHIEKSTYVTSHQTTNVYADHFCKYEIRISDDAMDIQVNDFIENE